MSTTLATNELLLTNSSLDFHAKRCHLSKAHTCLISRYIHQEYRLDPMRWEQIPKSARSYFSTIDLPRQLTIVKEQFSADGCIKWLFGLPEGRQIESVYIPTQDRATLCISSQMGCAMACGFCATGLMGFHRNLTASQIIAQLWTAGQRLSELHKPLYRGKHITNVVFMGMGEPLLNADAVIEACRMMLDDHAYGLSKYRVTVSTIGIIPGLQQLQQSIDVALAISLHAPCNEKRTRLVPMNKHFDIQALMRHTAQHFAGTRRKVLIEYIIIDQFNDQQQDVDHLIALLNPLPIKLNLMPMNAINGIGYKPPSDEHIRWFFGAIKKQANFPVTLRQSRGQDIAAACGQLHAASKRPQK